MVASTDRLQKGRAFVGDPQLDPSASRMMRKVSTLIVAAVLLVLVALYCFSGYAMNASFAGAGDSARYSGYAVRWAIAAVASLLLAIGCGVAAWRQSRRREPGSESRTA